MGKYSDLIRHPVTNSDPARRALLAEVERVFPETKLKQVHTKSNKRASLAPPRPASLPNSRQALIAAAVRSKIEAIEAEARARGWPAELLWNAGFWDRPRGLAAVLEPNDEIAGVTPEVIEIVKMRRDVLRFRRTNG
jgi:hypothetical protein